MRQDEENLFEYAGRERMRENQPLAARMRPRTLDEFVGQDHILAPGRLLRRAIQADQLSSLIFYGPPGTGKTTLASVVAHTTQSRFTVLNAVMAGVQDVRQVASDAQRCRDEYAQRTILFVDEVHRWNKAQQDALLPYVENGTVVFIGATTENPYFTVNRPLVSRSRIFQLKVLSQDELRQVARAALEDSERGYGNWNVHINEDALDHLTDVANGDARAVLNALELGVETTTPDENERIVIDLAVAEESIQRRAVLYDKEGDYHFDTISAFIKSLRGSDPDAAVYWLAKMVYAGEDPRFIFRRMLIFCGEDVGLADPQALTVVQSAAEAFDRVGMPEGRYHLGMAALYLATAPKSNSVFAFFDALSSVEKEGDAEVPTHLKDDHRDQEGFGHGQGYLYPHAYRHHWVAQQYLPEALQGRMFYEPGELGYEADIADQVRRRREVQLAAAMNPEDTGAPPEILTYSPADKGVDEWLARTMHGAEENLARVRDELFQRMQCQRHHTLLDVSGDDGVLTWEAVRQVPEGGVWALVRSGRAADMLRSQAEKLPALRRPTVLQGEPEKLPELLTENAEQLRFDRITGRNTLTRIGDRPGRLAALKPFLRREGLISVGEVVPAYTQRLYRLLDTEALEAGLFEKLAEAEEKIYGDKDDPMVNWDVADLKEWAEEAGLELLHEEPVVLELSSRVMVSDNLLQRWFRADAASGRRSYRERLAETLKDTDVEKVRQTFYKSLRGRAVDWNSRIVILQAKSAGNSR